MTDLLTVELKGLRFFAYHGLYPEEQKTGNEFEVNLSVSYQPASGVITAISETVNYVQLYELLGSEMKKPRQLLETLAMEVCEQIHQSYKAVKKISISVTKLQPPIVNFTGTVAVQYAKEY